MEHVRSGSFPHRHVRLMVIVRWNMAWDRSTGYYGSGYIVRPSEFFRDFPCLHLGLSSDHFCERPLSYDSNNRTHSFSHPDPPNITKYISGRDLVAAAGRNYLAGEYDW
jgi:hypothetical protein